MKIVVLLLSLSIASVASAQVYPNCPATSGPQQGQTTNCTIGVLITSTSTPVFAQLNGRQYLFLQDQGFANDSTAAFPICCAIGSNNAATWSSGTACNGIVLLPSEPGTIYEPLQMVAGQTPFRVPSGDISCISPLGNVELTGLQE